jgi:WD40 repeat protein
MFRTKQESAFMCSNFFASPHLVTTTVGTSLCLSPSGHFVWAGFSDGTVRVFDLCDRFDLGQETWQANRQKSTLMVPSTSHQRFGAVACQIHARGVHTDLLMQVNACGDFVFGGVPRGANEVYAVNIKELEAQARAGPRAAPPAKNILDYIDVHVHADAKLKGLGACTQLLNVSRPTYLVLTGKGIKNIHIWKFQPPLDQGPAVWEQLYDTQTNGNTIKFLSFYRNSEGKLWGISQSDTQKVRLWDLSVEEHDQPEASRPKRPDYEDVTNSQAALGIAGGYGICGGPTMYNQLSIVSLDNPKSIFNHTELALPGEASGGRQRRGDLKQVVNVATLPNDSNHALLELDDVSGWSSQRSTGCVSLLTFHGKFSVNRRDRLFTILQISQADRSLRPSQKRPPVFEIFQRTFGVEHCV